MGRAETDTWETEFANNREQTPLSFPTDGVQGTAGLRPMMTTTSGEEGTHPAVCKGMVLIVDAEIKIFNSFGTTWLFSE